MEGFDPLELEAAPPENPAPAPELEPEVEESDSNASPIVPNITRRSTRILQKKLSKPKLKKRYQYKPLLVTVAQKRKPCSGGIKKKMDGNGYKHCINCYADLTNAKYPLATELPPTSSTIFELIYDFFKLYLPKHRTFKLLESNKCSYSVCTHCYDKLYLLNELLRKLYSATKAPSILSKFLPKPIPSKSAESVILIKTERLEDENGGSDSEFYYFDECSNIEDQKPRNHLTRTCKTENLKDSSDYEMSNDDENDNEDVLDSDETVDDFEPEEDSEFIPKLKRPRKSVKTTTGTGTIDSPKRTKDKRKPVACPTCCATFSKYDHYKRHAQTSHATQDIPCKVCGGGFHNHNALLSHTRLYHFEHWKKTKEKDATIATTNTGSKKSVSCPDCCAQFQTKYHYELHASSDHTSKDFTCEHCNGTFGTETGLKSHQKIYHESPDPEPAENENQTEGMDINSTNNEQTVEPANRNKGTDRSYSCPNCCAAFLQNNHYKRHALTSHTSKDIICNECNGTFNTDDSLKKHLKWYHSSERNSVPETEETPKSKPVVEPYIKATNNPRSQCQCPNCCASFSKTSHYKRHAILSHSNISKDSSYTCEQCPWNGREISGGIFNSELSLNSHVKWYHTDRKRKIKEEDDGEGEHSKSKLDFNVEVEPPLKNKNSARPYSCPNCCAKFVTYYHYKRHAVSGHTSKNVTCGKCNGTFSSELTLQVHQRLYHGTGTGSGDNSEPDDGSEDEEVEMELGEPYYPPLKPTPQPHPCPQCAIELCDKRELKLHLVNEHGMIMETKLQCPVCPRRCASKEVLDKHMEKYHLVRVVEKVHGCEICGHRFAKKHDLSNHMTTHTNERNYICEFCAFAGKRVQDLSRHIQQVHLKPANYSCETCGKKFVKHYQLVNHQVCHTDAKNFPCPECSKSFRSSNNLRQHRYTHQQIKHLCIHCGNSYTRLAYLNKHIKTAHNNVTTESASQSVGI